MRLQNIIFLDIDGVCNSDYWFYRSPDRPKSPWDRRLASMLDPRACARLQHIVDATKASIVVSSSWRISSSVRRIKDALAQRGFKGRFIGRTPSCGWTGIHPKLQITTRNIPWRGLEIETWLDENFRRRDLPNLRCIILDDSSDMGRLTPRLVSTTWAFGLLDEHVDVAIQRLQEPLGDLMARRNRLFAPRSFTHKQ